MKRAGLLAFGLLLTCLLLEGCSSRQARIRYRETCMRACDAAQKAPCASPDSLCRSTCDNDMEAINSSCIDEERAVQECYARGPWRCEGKSGLFPPCEKEVQAAAECEKGRGK